jgi:hypothetical protein
MHARIFIRNGVTIVWEKHMGTEASRWVVVLLEVGAVGYLVGAVAWSLFWLELAYSYVGMWVAYLPPYILYFAVSLSFVMVGVGCFALSKLFGSWPAAATGVADVAAAVPFFVIGLFHLMPQPPLRLGSWPGLYIPFIGNGLVILSLFLWMTLTTYDLARSGFRLLRIAIGALSLVSVIVFLFVLPILGWIPYGLTPLTELYVLAQVLSAVLLHKISSHIQRKPHDPKQAYAVAPLAVQERRDG